MLESNKELNSVPERKTLGWCVVIRAGHERLEHLQYIVSFAIFLLSVIRCHSMKEIDHLFGW